MKKLSVLCVAILCVLPLFAANANEKWGNDYEAALKESAESGRPILANFTGSDWCPYCVKLEKEVFATDEFKEWAETNAVLLVLDFPRRRKPPADVQKQNKELAGKYGIRGYPTVLILDEKGNKIGRTGYSQGGPEKWIANVARTVSPYIKEKKAGKIAAEKAVAEKAAEEKAAREAAAAKAQAERRAKLSGQGYRDWTDKDGKTVFAKFFASVEGVVGLIGENGAKIRVPLDSFSDADQQYIAENHPSN